MNNKIYRIMVFFDKKKNEYAELCHVVNFECSGWQ